MAKKTNLTCNEGTGEMKDIETKRIPLPVSTVEEVHPMHGVQIHFLTGYVHLKIKWIGYFNYPKASIHQEHS